MFFELLLAQVTKRSKISTTSLGRLKRTWNYFSKWLRWGGAFFGLRRSWDRNKTIKVMFCWPWAGMEAFMQEFHVSTVVWSRAGRTCMVEEFLAAASRQTCKINWYLRIFHIQLPTFWNLTPVSYLLRIPKCSKKLSRTLEPSALLKTFSTDFTHATMLSGPIVAAKSGPKKICSHFSFVRAAAKCARN